LHKGKERRFDGGSFKKTVLANTKVYKNHVKARE